MSRIKPNQGFNMPAFREPTLFSLKDEHENDNNPFRQQYDPEAEKRKKEKEAMDSLRAKEKAKSDADAPIVAALDDDKKKKKRSYWKKLFIAFFFNFGPTIGILLYVILGAVLFRIVEQNLSLQSCERGSGNSTTMITNYRNKIFNYIYLNTTAMLPNSSSAALIATRDTTDTYTKQVMSYLTSMRDEIVLIKSTYGYYGQTDCAKTNLWSMESAMLFTISIVTTIGYGHVTPQTWQGQLIFVSYAIYGIALFLITLTNIKGSLAELFRGFYRNFVCLVCNRIKKIREEEEFGEEKAGEGVVPIGGAAGAASAAAKKKKRMAGDENGDEVDHGKIQAEVIDDYEDEDEDDDADENKKLDPNDLPFIYGFSIFVLYLLIGGGIFSGLEGWTFIQAVYFAFVSLSTIGFGDFVPGIAELQKGNATAGAGNIFLTVIYVIIGMATMATFLDLIQYGMQRKIKYISELCSSKKKDE